MGDCAVRTEPTNARFWVYINGDFVKLTMNPGDVLEHYSSEDTEEGWASEYDCWSYEDGVIDREYVSDGRDCDGRLSHASQSYCRVGALKADESPKGPTFLTWETRGNPPCDSHLRPLWIFGDSSQRDYSAEAMGY